MHNNNNNKKKKANTGNRCGTGCQMGYMSPVLDLILFSAGHSVCIFVDYERYDKP